MGELGEKILCSNQSSRHMPTACDAPTEQCKWIPIFWHIGLLHESSVLDTHLPSGGGRKERLPQQRTVQVNPLAGERQQCGLTLGWLQQR
jgi:hypothetical protein